METFIRIMYESLEMEQYEDVQYDPNKAERIEFLSLFVYFEKIKKVLSAKEIEAYILEDTLIEIGLNEKEKIIRSGLISDAVFQLTDSVCCRWIGTDSG